VTGVTLLDGVIGALCVIVAGARASIADGRRLAARERPRNKLRAVWPPVIPDRQS